MRRGFTLIELLVVVLIIGVLAAIALPQYRIAVEKARVAEALVNLHAIARANQVYYMANGTYADVLSDLDVQIPGEITTYIGRQRPTTDYFQYDVMHTNGLKVLALANRLPAGGRYYLSIKPSAPARVYCEAYESSSIGKQMCQVLSHGKKIGGYYVIE